MTLDEHILYEDIWVAAVVEVPPNVSLGYEIITNKVNRCLARYSPRATTTN